MTRPRPGRPSLDGSDGSSGQVFARLPPALHARLEEIRRRLGARSLSEALRYAVERVRLPRRR